MKGLALPVVGLTLHPRVHVVSDTKPGSNRRRLRMGNAYAAVDLSKQALELAQRIGARGPETKALVKLANALRALRQHNPAATQARSALDSARMCGFGILEGQALTLLARIELDQGNRHEAGSHVEKALENHRRTGHRLGEADTLMLLAELVTDPGIAMTHRRAADEIYGVVRSTVLTDFRA